MVIKKKSSSNVSSKRINKPDKDKRKSFDSKSTSKQSIVTSSSNLRVTGANVSGGNPDAVSVPVQCNISEDNYNEAEPSDDDQKPEIEQTNAFDSDNDGFVVRRLLKKQETAAHQLITSAHQSAEVQDTNTNQIAYYTSLVRPPPTAPRSSPVYGLGDSIAAVQQRTADNARQ